MQELINDSELIMKRKQSSKSETVKLIRGLFDKGSFIELNLFLDSYDNGLGLVCGNGLVNGRNVYVFAEDSSANGGAVCRKHAQKLKKLYSLALKTGSPIVGIYDSYGADLNEGNEVLSEYSTLLNECSKMSGVVPQISIVKGMCFGVSAIIAASADVLILESTAKCGLDIGGSSSSKEYCESHGISHITCESSEESISKAREILSILPSNNISCAPILEYVGPKNSRNYNLQTIDGLINSLVDDKSFIEFQSKFGKHFKTGLATIKGRGAGIIVSDFEGSDVIDADSSTKVSRFVRFCDSYSIPVITLINAEKFESLNETSRVCSVYSEATCPKITIAIGKTLGAVNVAFCGQDSIDIVLAWEGSVISALSPKTAVEVLWHDRLKGDGTNYKELRKDLEEEYKSIKSSSIQAAKSGLVDEIILPNETRSKIEVYLLMIQNKREIRLPKKHSNMRI